MKSIQQRLVILFILVTTATFGAFAAYEQLLLYRQLETRFDELQTEVIHRLQSSLSEPVWVLDTNVITAKLESALIPLDVHSAYLFDPEQTRLSAGVSRDEQGRPQPILKIQHQEDVAVEADIFPPPHIDETRRKISIGKVVVHFSRDRIERTLWEALIRRTLEVLAMNLLLLAVLTLSLRMVFVPLRRLRDALFKLATEEGDELAELPKTLRTEFDEVIDGFNLALRKLKKIIVRSTAAERAARDATQATNEALQQLKSAQQALIEQNAQLELLAVTDRLTGLCNRLKLDRELESELNRSRRYTSTFALVLLDIDHFKSTNDMHGHQVGDQVLIEVAQLLGDGTRNVDIVGRWGGEEFLIICPDTDLDGAIGVAEKLRQMIAAHPFPGAGRITASFGVTGIQPGDSAHLMMARADGALYQSKARGRNRVERAP